MCVLASMHQTGSPRCEEAMPVPWPKIAFGLDLLAFREVLGHGLGLRV